jgi:hypothetical protein
MENLQCNTCGSSFEDDLARCDICHQTYCVECLDQCALADHEHMCQECAISIRFDFVLP